MIYTTYMLHQCTKGWCPDGCSDWFIFRWLSILVDVPMVVRIGSCSGGCSDRLMFRYADDVASCGSRRMYNSDIEFRFLVVFSS